MRRIGPTPSPGIVPGTYQCVRCRRSFRNRMRWLLRRPPCCPHCLSFRIIPSGCVRLPGDPPQ